MSKRVLIDHQQAGTSAVAPGFWSYTLPHALACVDIPTGVPNNHGTDSWGSDVAIADQQLALNVVDALATGPSGSGSVLIGASMGGNLAMNVAKAGVLSDLKGVYLIDAAVNLNWMYNNAYTNSINTGLGITAGTLSAAMASTGLTSVPTTASFPTIGTVLMIGAATANVETVTTTAASTGTAVAVTATTKTHASADPVSNYPTVSAGKDPCLFTSGQLPAGIRWRATASTADTTVSKTNNIDVLAPIIAGATPLEWTSLLHPGTHLVNAALPKDIVAFVKRCFGL